MIAMGGQKRNRERWKKKKTIGKHKKPGDLKDPV